MPINHKVDTLNKIKKECLRYSTQYKKSHQKLKKRDNVIDGVNAVLNATSITCIINSPAVPPLVIAAAVSSALQFVLSRIQDKMRWKEKMTAFLTTSNQYHNMASEICVVLHKNGLSNEQYGEYLEEVNDKISLIRDTQLF